MMGRKKQSAALALAKTFGAELQSISIKNGPAISLRPWEKWSRNRKRRTDSTRGLVPKLMAKQEGLELKCTVLAVHQVETIVRFTRDGRFDLLVVGFMGHSRAFGRIWAARRRILVKTSPCSVLVAK